MYPPVLLFVFRRSKRLDEVLDRLEACEGFSKHDVFIHSDGPRNRDDEPYIAAVRSLVRKRLRSNMQLVEQDRNRGVAKAIVDEVTNACARYGQAIVLEDDLLLAPMALRYFSEGLARYADEPTVMQIAGFNFAVPAIRKAGRSVFMQHPTAWGWATNARSWAKFDPDCTGWEADLADPDFHARFAVGNAMRFVDMLRLQMSGRLDAWDIRWHHAVIKARGLVLFPPQSMIRNIGHLVGQATNGQRSAPLLPIGPMWMNDHLPPFPERVAVDDWAIQAWSSRLKWSSYGAAIRLSSAMRRVRDRLTRSE